MPGSGIHSHERTFGVLASLYYRFEAWDPERVCDFLKAAQPARGHWSNSYRIFKARAVGAGVVA